jgi:hypothetical protein
MKTVLLATFHEVGSAQQLQARLQQAGMHAMLTDDSKLQRFWLVAKPLAAIHVEVLRTDYQEAVRLIEHWQPPEGALNNAVRCPACHSPRVEFPQLTRKFVTPSLGSLLMAVGLLPREFYCTDCHYTWPTAVHLDAKRDALGWPSESKLWHPEQGPRKS